MDEENVIIVDHVSKNFKVYIDKGNQLKEKILFRNRNRYEERPVLKDISFQVKKGEAVGLVGHNGCGKSTTLKLLTKIIFPDSGTVTMKGRVAALIELGAGFHPDMSGRENIYTNAAIFGLTRKEIDDKLDDIIAFSELEAFIDNPVRTYSSGMYTRLAFSVAINVDADILLIDEILAVGDAAFQAKCFNRLKEIKAKGTTIVIVSHSLNQIEEICERSIWIHDGYIREEGIPEEVHKSYLDYIEEYRIKMAEKEVQRLEEKKKNMKNKADTGESGDDEKTGPVTDEEQKMTTDSADEEEQNTESGEKQWVNGEETTIKITDVRIYNGEGVGQKIIKTGERIRLELDYRILREEESPIFAIGIMRYDGVLCYSTNTKIDGVECKDIKRQGTVAIEVPKLDLLPNTYFVDVAVMQSDGTVVDYCSHIYTFEMMSRREDTGVIRIPHEWTFVDKE